MNAFEVRKYLMSNAKSIMDEADERMVNDKDPLTDECWEGSKQLFYLKYKTVLDWAGKSNDPLPELEDSPDTEVDNISYKLQLITEMMLNGKIDANTAESMLKASVAFISIRDRNGVEDKIDEVANLIESMAKLSDHLPV